MRECAIERKNRQEAKTAKRYRLRHVLSSGECLQQISAFGLIFLSPTLTFCSLFIFLPESPNLGNVFVRDSTEIFLGGDRRPLEGSSNAEDEVEDGTHQMWDQLLAAHMLQQT